MYTNNPNDLGRTVLLPLDPFNSAQLHLILLAILDWGRTDCYVNNIIYCWGLFVLWASVCKRCDFVGMKNNVYYDNLPMSVDVPYDFIMKNTPYLLLFYELKNYNKLYFNIIS